jgi:hypothetical protein
MFDQDRYVHGDQIRITSPGGAGKKMRNVSNIDQPSRELEEHDDSITASALGVYR